MPNNIPIYVLNGQNRVQLLVSSAELRKEIMGEFVLTADVPDYSLSLSDVLQIDFNGQTFTFDIRSIDGTKVTAEHISYRLRGRVLQDKYINDPPTYDDRLDFAAIRLADLITALNSLYVEAGFQLVNNTSSDVEADISFSGDNLLSALQKIAETYNVEYYATDTTIVFKDKIGSDKGEIIAGYHIKTVSCQLDKSDLVTRIYPVGSSENLPDGYYYDRLRPTTFNVETKQHSGVLYVEDSEAVAQWGLIEKIVEFPDVSIASRSGVVSSTGVGYIEKYSKTFPYIQSSTLIGINDEKALSSVLFIVQGLNAAELQIVFVDSGAGRVYYSPYLKDGGTLSWTPQAGDKFVLIGYIDQPEMNAARDKLIETATKYLAQYSKPRAKYSANTVYKENLWLDIGDTVTLKDPHQLSGIEINEQVRIVSFTYDFVLGAYSTVEFSNETKAFEDYLWRETLRLRDSLEVIRRGLNRVTQTTFPNLPTFDEKPASPADIVAVWGEDNGGVYVDLSWTAVSGAVGYRVRYSYDNQNFYYPTDTTNTSVKIYVDIERIAKVEEYSGFSKIFPVSFFNPSYMVHVGVAAISSNNNLSDWKTATIEFNNFEAVVAPTIVSLRSDNTVLFVQLEYPSEGLKNVAYFHIEASTTPLFGIVTQAVTTALNTSFSVADIMQTNSETIYVRARAVSKKSTASSWSSVKSIEIIRSYLEEPSPPTNLQLSTGVDHLGAYVEASWTAPAQSVDYYDVGYSYDNIYFTQLPSVSTTSIRFYVTAGSVVTVRVAAVDAGLRSAWITGSISVSSGLILPPPTSVTAKGIFTDVQVAFEFPKEKLSFVNGFEIQISKSQFFDVTISAVTTGTIETVKADQFLEGDETTVYVRVRTISRTGEYSTWSNTVSTTIWKIKGTYIAEATIDSANIREAAIKSAHIDKAQITTAHVKELDASVIKSGYISADRIESGSINVDKLAAKMYLTGKTIIAGDENRNFTLNEKGIRRVINKSGVVFDKEIGTILVMTNVYIPPNGIAKYKLPNPLMLEDVEVFLQPLSFPISRSGVPADESWSYRVGYKQISLNEIEIYSYISKDSTRTTIMNGILIPTGSWYSAQTGSYTERVHFYVQEMYFPGWWTEHNFDHSYTTPKNYTVKIRWTGVSAGCYVQIDWGDGTMSQKQIGSWLTTGIYAWGYAYNYSTNPTIYYTSGNVILMLIDKRD